MLWFVHVLKTVDTKQFKGIHSPKLGMREDSGGASPYKPLLSTLPPPPRGLNLSPDNFHHRKHCNFSRFGVYCLAFKISQSEMLELFQTLCLLGTNYNPVCNFFANFVMTDIVQLLSTKNIANCSLL